ncbi:DUF1461 domain-containing protein [Candidatus Woesearchaeota archaeon]|nr:DUF1461 domain-containing protein [Candidatus Woesearchaeota archaeon]
MKKKRINKKLLHRLEKRFKLLKKREQGFNLERIVINAFQGLIVLSLVFLSFATPTMLVLNSESLWLSISKHYQGSVENVKIVYQVLHDQKARMHANVNATDIIKYLKQVKHVTLKELQHLMQVKQVVKNFENLTLIIIVLVVLSVFLFVKALTQFFKLLITTGFLILVLVIIIALLLLNFEFSFELFHKIVFKENYSFPQHSFLIQAFPEQFFQTMASIILGIATMIGGLFVSVGKLGLRKTS